MKKKLNIQFDRYSCLCLSCAGCVAVCEEGALHMEDLTLEIDQMKCKACGACIHFCPVGALAYES
jgi:ferredoxin